MLMPKRMKYRRVHRGNMKGKATRGGKVLFEIGGIREDLAKEALMLAAHKLPIDTRFVAKESAADMAAFLPGRGAQGDAEATEVAEVAGAGKGTSDEAAE